MQWREAKAAYQANALAIWFELPDWQRTWIVAITETMNDIANIPME